MTELGTAAGPAARRTQAGLRIAATAAVWVVSSIFAREILKALLSTHNLHPHSPTALVSTVVIPFVPWVLAGVFPFLWGWMTLRELGFCRPAATPGRTVRVMLVAGVLSVAVLLAFLSLVRLLAGEVTLPRVIVSPALLVASLSGLALSSTGEEFVFRGALQPLANQSLEGRLKLGPLQIRWGTLAVAALFGLIHLVAGGGAPPGVPVRAWRVAQTFGGFALGLIFGQVRDRLETVWVPAFLHILANLTLCLLLLQLVF